MTRALERLEGSPPLPNKPLTNADYIRAMSDKELAVEIVAHKGTRKRITTYGEYERYYVGTDGETCGDRSYAIQLWIDWLHQPEEESMVDRGESYGEKTE